MLPIFISPAHNFFRLTCALGRFIAVSIMAFSMLGASAVFMASVFMASVFMASEAQSQEKGSLLNINSLVIAPSTLSSASVSKELGSFSLSVIEEALQTAFRSATNSDVVLMSSVKGFNKNLLNSPISSQSAFAKQSGFDGLLQAEIQSFSNRSGSAIGSNEGAKLGIGLKIYNIKSGQVAWEGNYFEQDNAAPLISVTGGEFKSPQFRSVESLIKEGAEKLSADFSAARLTTYLVK